MKRAKHSLSHYRLATMKMGYLMPITCMEVLPGDTFRHATQALVRVSPMVAPVMHPCHIAIHHWFVPSRLLWDKWEEFITGRIPDQEIPQIALYYNDSNGAANRVNSRRLANDFGIGLNQDDSRDLGDLIRVNALPFRAYNLIWNEFYRDQNLQSEVPFNTGDGLDSINDYQRLVTNWQKDYFTTARPYPQQGEDTSVAALDLNLGVAPVTGDGTQASYREASGTPQPLGFEGTSNQFLGAAGATAGGSDGWENTGMQADLTNLTGAANLDINEWRKAMAMQKIREHRNRFGERYTDYLRFLGVDPMDSRLDRPEYLGGGKQTISFSEILSTVETEESALGTLGGHGIAAIRTRPYKRFFQEHGFVMSLMMVRPKAIYTNNIPRKYIRQTYDTYWQKELEMMGEQAVPNAEIYANSEDPSGVFGWVQRHDEYRREQSYVSGEFRGGLDYWHLGRKFDEQPVLNPSFLECLPSDRIYADQNVDHLQVMANHRIAARRLVSKKARS